MPRPRGWWLLGEGGGGRGREGANPDPWPQASPVLVWRGAREGREAQTLPAKPQATPLFLSPLPSSRGTSVGNTGPAWGAGSVNTGSVLKVGGCGAEKNGEPGSLWGRGGPGAQVSPERTALGLGEPHLHTGLVGHLQSCPSSPHAGLDAPGASPSLAHPSTTLERELSSARNRALEC